MLKKLKQATLKSLKSSGGFRVAAGSRWRRGRLLILGYHGVALEDEHLWEPALFVPPSLFRERLRLIKSSGCNVLPLGEAVRRLYANDLPDRAVAITFDDGTHDFHARAYPLLREFDLPATLYLTTFYARYNRPVFDVAVSYLLWKGRALSLELREFTGRDARVELASEEARAAAQAEICETARSRGLSAEEKDALAASLARALGVDYDALLARRILHLVDAGEARELSGGGVDIQLHTHRHRVPLERDLFRREIEDNRRLVREWTGRDAEHFCYPSGVHDPRLLPWLEELGVLSATTCETGLASRESHRLLLPRLLDTCSLSPVEFEGWLTGVSAALPRRAVGSRAAAY